MTLAEFRASARPVSDEAWAAVLAFVPSPAPRAAFREYAEGGWLLHEAEGAWWPHAWWYSPRPLASLADAEADLYAWRAEFL